MMVAHLVDEVRALQLLHHLLTPVHWAVDSAGQLLQPSVKLALLTPPLLMKQPATLAG